LTDAGRLVTTAASDAIVERADTLQYEVDSGPCLEAMRTMRVVRVDDLARETRWPDWTARARQLPVASVLSVPLRLHGDITGALKVYATQPAHFGDREERLLTMFAEQAAVLLANVRSRDELEEANARLRAVVHSRDLISMAKGILMVRDDLTEQAAFTALAETARQQDVTVGEIARRILDPHVGRAS
jgi:GAF domain-containing protein